MLPVFRKIMIRKKKITKQQKFRPIHNEMGIFKDVKPCRSPVTTIVRNMQAFAKGKILGTSTFSSSNNAFNALKRQVCLVKGYFKSRVAT